MITILETRDPALVATLNEEVQNLHATLHPELFKPYHKEEVTEAIKQMLANHKNTAYIAYYDGVPAGSLLCCIRETNDNAFRYGSRTLYIDQISVPEQYRKLGIGQLLLQHAEQLAAALGISELQLDHWSANTVAAHYFRKNGYAVYREQLSKTL